MLKKIETKIKIYRGKALGRRLMALALCFILSFSLIPTAQALSTSEISSYLSSSARVWAGASELSRKTAIDRLVNYYSVPKLPMDSTAQEYTIYKNNYKSWSQNGYQFTGDGKIFQFSNVTDYYILEGEYLQSYYQMLALKWWNGLSNSTQESYLKQWSAEAKSAGVTQAQRSDTVTVKVTAKMFSDAGYQNMETTSFILPATAASYYWICIGGQSPKWNGEGEGKSVKNTYLLRVDTGTLPGTNVLYLGVRYQDVQGIERTEFLFPHENSLHDGYAMAEQYGTPENRQKLVMATTGYSAGAGYGSGDGLSANSYDSYLFTPHYELKEFIGLDVFMRYPMDKAYTKGWTCTGLYFYRVDELYGIDMAGYYSDTCYISFKGELLSRLVEDSVDFELEKSDILYRLGRETAVNYNMEKVSIPYDSRADEYLFKIDFADTYGGGIEALAANYNNGNRLQNVIEALTLRVTYLDNLDEERTVNMPVITSMLAWAAEKGAVDSSLPIAGVAQQGESVMFPGRLPDFKDFKSITLIYGSDAAAVAGISAPNSTDRSTRLKALAGDSISIAGFQIYDADVGVSMGPSSQIAHNAKLDLVVDNTSAPIYYYTCNNTSGLTVKPGRTILSDLMRPYTSGAPLKPKSEQSNYLVVITTDEMNRAGTKEDVHLRLGYVSTTGANRESDAISLREAAQNYYGYWPGAEGDSAYTGAMSANGQIAFTLPITDVNKFTSATFSMNSLSTDDWQMKDIKIYSISELGQRQIVWENTGFSDRRITRPFEEAEQAIIARYPNLLDDAEESKVYLGGNIFTETIYFGEDSKSVVEEEKKIDWSEIRYSMTYKEALQDLGFVRADSTYKVEVKVASNNESNMDSGDCGSQNLFYFKLIFESGSSGYVLANQQLTADGFRADRIETFYVTTNEDYGALSAISIIPEDDSGSDNQDPFDKLNISNIVVTKQADGGVAKSWRVENVGWIDVNYRDKGAESTASGRPGRTEGEIAHSYPVTSQGYSMNLLFALSTGSYERSESDVNSSSGVNPTYQGSLVATIEYYDTNGMIRKQSVDVVRAMYEYAAKTPEYYGETYRTADGTNETRAKSDPSFMFRGGHVDRFYVTLTDVKQIIRVRLGASSEVATRWKLDRMDIYQICSDGVLQLSATDEYKRTNKVEPLCESVDDIGYDLQVFAPENSMQTLGEEQVLVVNMTSNSIDIKTEGSNWTSAITKEPTNKNDTLNIYIYMSEGGIPITDYDLNCSVVWGSADTASEHSDAIGRLEKSRNANMFYYTGYKVSGISALYAISLKGNYRDVLNAGIDHVVVQHVRSGVTINSYYFNFGGANAEHQQTKSYDPNDPDYDTNETAHGKQVVRIFFATDMKPITLLPNASDVAVAIRYRTTNDAEKAGGSENIYYNSTYEFLSKQTQPDGKIAKYTKITPGMVAEVEFNEPYVGEIVGVTLATVGNVSAELDSACVGLYADGGSDTIGWYNFANGAILSTTPYTIQATSKSVTPVKMVFTTDKDAKTVSSGGDSGMACPIRMTVVYTSAQTGGREELTISDIRKYLSSGDFRVEADGSNTATIQLFMKDVSAIRSITLEPYTSDTASSAIWGLKDVYCEAIVDGTVKASEPVAVNRLIAEDSPVSVNFSTVFMKLKASAYNDTSGVTVERSTDVNGSTEIAVRSGGNVTITPTITGSLDGYGFTVSATSESGAEVFCYTVSGGKIVFTPPENESESVVKYNVTVSSQESPNVQCSVLVNVESRSAERNRPIAPEPTSEETT